MDISKITDLKELKAMAYDALAARQTAEENLIAINTQISRVMSNTANPTPAQGEDDNGTESTDAKA